MGGKSSSLASPTNLNQSMKLGISHKMPRLPEEIIFEILSRLPVKSLLRFKCVSKSWLSLISCPRFIKTHLEISTKDPTKHQILIATRSRPWAVKQCSVSSLSFEPFAADLFDIIYPMEFHESAFCVMGSCNGLICLGARETLYLWNPATRMSTKLPSINTKIHYIESCGIGYVESADDYKVVVILEKYDEEGMLYKYDDEEGNYESSQMHIYSLNTGSWKRIDDFKGGYTVSAYGVFASGKLHFSMSPGATDLDSAGDIISIDLESEVNGIIEKPDLEEGSCESDLVVLGGCICVVSKNQSARVVDVWVLKEYGVKESWTKMFAIPYIFKPWRPLLLRPLFVLPNDLVVMILEKGLGVYSEIDNRLRCFEVSPHPYGNAGFYVESLDSPK